MDAAEVQNSPCFSISHRSYCVEFGIAITIRVGFGMQANNQEDTFTDLSCNGLLPV